MVVVAMGCVSDSTDVAFFPGAKLTKWEKTGKKRKEWERMGKKRNSHRKRAQKSPPCEGGRGLRGGAGLFRADGFGGPISKRASVIGHKLATGFPGDLNKPKIHDLPVAFRLR